MTHSGGTNPDPTTGGTAAEPQRITVVVTENVWSTGSQQGATGDGFTGSVRVGRPGILSVLLTNLFLAIAALLAIFVIVPFLILLLLWSLIGVTYRMIRGAITGRDWVGGQRVDRTSSAGIPQNDRAGRENVRVRKPE
ncbi:MAG: hypothetical protein KF768_07000 [Phycisphaeraceae bacterium]|nr:hypothetical protein [Phycisphaeraceae bacterium]